MALLIGEKVVSSEFITDEMRILLKKNDSGFKQAKYSSLIFDKIKHD